MNIAAFDIGGTAVKYGLWEGDHLTNKGSFPTPRSWEEMKQGINDKFNEFKSIADVSAAGFSFPGAVNTETGTIGGLSAVHYIHNFPIQQELANDLGVPVHIENDANCAALAEVKLGAAKEVKDCLFVVVGTGIGGAVIVNRELVKGPNLFGGEFGFMLLDGINTWSMLGTPYQAARRYSKKTGETIDGKELFKRSDEGDEVAQAETETFFHAMAQGIHNLLACFNPEVLVIGGAISARPGLLEKLTEEVEELQKRTGSTDVEANLVPCAYRNDANLIGAISGFLNN